MTWATKEMMIKVNRIRNRAPEIQSRAEYRSVTGTWAAPCVKWLLFSFMLVFIQNKIFKLRWALFITYTIIQSITSSEMCSLHLTPSSTHTWSSGQPTPRRPGSSWGFGALLKGLTSVVDNSYRSRDSNFEPTTSGYKSNALSIRATTAPVIIA